MLSMNTAQKKCYAIKRKNEKVKAKKVIKSGIPKAGE